MTDSSNTPLKRCSACGQEFPATFFWVGYKRCKSCARVLRQKRYVSPEGYKRCSKCHEIKLATTEYFHHSQKERDHLTSRCRECINASKRKNPLPEPVPEGYKHCSQCKTIKPATLEYFYRDLRNRSRLDSWCKPCTLQYQLEHRKPRIQPDETHRTCSKCGEVYPATPAYFYRNVIGLNGLSTVCKQCIYVQGIQYRKNNKGIIQIRMQRWRQKKREHVLSYGRQHYYSHREQYAQRWQHYWKEHREEILKHGRIYYASHRDQMIARTRERRKIRPFPSDSKHYQQEYYRTHRDYYIAKAHRRRALIGSIPGTYTAQEVREQYNRQHGKCYYCRHKVKWGRHHLDHTLPISRPYARNSIDHLVITCKSCNLRKGNKYPHEFPEGNRLL